MRKIIQGWLVVMLLFGISCKPACTEGSGPSGEENRNPGTFASVKSDIPCTVVIRKGTASGIKIIAQEDIRKLIKTELSGNTLTLEATSCFQTEETVRIELLTADLDEVELSGSGTVLIEDTFQVKEMSLTVSGSGTIKGRVIAAQLHADVSGSGTLALTGSANKLNAELSGSGLIDAGGLPCKQADASVEGSGNIRLYVLEKLKSAIAGSGNVYYKGNPDIKSNITGSGKVVSEN
jgi:Putative auto-transporter adhesin, head GIN domain